MDYNNEICKIQPENESMQCMTKQNPAVSDKSSPAVQCGKSSDNKPLSRITPLIPTNLKRIRICTPADLKNLCEPEECVKAKKSKRQPIRIAPGVGKFWSFGLKSAIAGGIAYWTYSIGLWGKADDTEKLYKEMCKRAHIYKWEMFHKSGNFTSTESAKKIKRTCDPFEAYNDAHLKMDNKPKKRDIVAEMPCQHAPSISENVNCFKRCWNRFVLKAFSFFSANESKNVGDSTNEETGEGGQKADGAC